MYANFPHKFSNIRNVFQFTKLGLRNRTERVVAVKQNATVEAVTVPVSTGTVPIGVVKGTPQAVRTFWDTSVLAKTHYLTGTGNDLSHE